MKRIFAVIYDVMILALSYLLFDSIIFNISSISVINGSIGIIGGADMPTLLFVLTKNPVMFLMALFNIFNSGNDYYYLQTSKIHAVCGCAAKAATVFDCYSEA